MICEGKGQKRFKRILKSLNKFKKIDIEKVWNVARRLVAITTWTSTVQARRVFSKPVVLFVDGWRHSFIQGMVQDHTVTTLLGPSRNQNLSL
uniref:Uncharacterized protein n=1 Tax=Physcomitrium patens TaxID=3218 RepID=A0A2K1KTJ0_PHYPA|nr:hypothetical protein PHYPA_004084 [Physcomitrium patens]